LPTGVADHCIQFLRSGANLEWWRNWRERLRRNVTKSHGSGAVRPAEYQAERHGAGKQSEAAGEFKQAPPR
jgi:hypothetical protein